MEASSYKAETSFVYNSIQSVRNNFDLVELYKQVKKKGDVLELSNELGIKPRILASAVREGRIRNLFPKINESYAGILSKFKTDRELKLFVDKYNFYEVSARKLIKLVKEWNHELEKNPLKLLTNEEHEFIMGTLLGDSNIKQRNKYSALRFGHSLKQVEYFLYKVGRLNKFGVADFRRTKKVVRGRETDMFEFSTRTHPVFNYYRNLFYGSGDKKVTKAILNELTPRSLAVWVCDDGSYCNTLSYIIMCTNSFSKEDHELMQKYFKDKWGLKTTIGFRDNKYYYLRFLKADTKKLIEIIRPYLPNSMLYKIGEKNE